MKKIFSIFLFIFMLNTIVYAGVEIPECIKVKMSDETIEEIELETYLYGVVQSEMGLTYKASDMKTAEKVPLEALKAQAVASRSYAVYTIQHSNNEAEYHVTSTTSSQVYKNIKPDSLVKQAVDETAGEVIIYDGQVACAYFFSTSGGRTEAPENVWTAVVPYLKGIEDTYEIEVDGKSTWKATYTMSELESKFPNIGDIEGIEVTEISENERVIQLEIIGSKGSTILLKNNIRTKFGSTKLKSQWFDVEFDGEEVVFEGRGFGHGVGMSQNGAIGMALEGFTYDEILKWYYTDIDILGYDKINDKKEEYNNKVSNKDNDNEMPDEDPKPMLEKLTEICTTNWLLEGLKL